MTPPTETVLCPTCNASFAKEDAPWLKQRQYCSIHDRVYFGKCEFCTPEQEAARAEAESKAQEDAKARVE